jgi:hypothetical protein
MLQTICLQFFSRLFAAFDFGTKIALTTPKVIQWQTAAKFSFAK